MRVLTGSRHRSGWLRPLLGLLVGGVASLLSGPMRAGDFSVAPMEITLGPQARTGVLRITNRDSRPLSFQIEALDWSQNDLGEAVHKPASDLVIFPRLLTLPAGAEGAVRLGLRQPLVSAEKTYLIYATEQPTASAEGASGPALQVLLRVGALVFVQPAQSIQRLEAVPGTMERGQVHLGVRNAGNRHLVLDRVTVTGLDAQGGQVFTASPSTPRYLLAQTTRRLPVTVPPADCARVARLELRVSAGTHQVRQTFETDGSSCP